MEERRALGVLDDVLPVVLGRLGQQPPTVPRRVPDVQ